ncbi:MAG: dihydropteroate synthase [Acidimicrobiales bacterium]
MVLVMGVLNVTPDSFSDGGRWFEHDRAIQHGLDLIAQGADVVDVGGESTRPGAHPVPPEEELRRVIPVIEALAQQTRPQTTPAPKTTTAREATPQAKAQRVRLSIDTRSPSVARAALNAGATILNDVSATLWPIAAEAGVGWIGMHMPADPSVMISHAQYTDVVAEVLDYLVALAQEAAAGGVKEIWIDPGIGFAKTAQHNLTLLRHLDSLVATGWPVLVGTSRKSFLGAITTEDPDGSPPPPGDRLEGSLATEAWALAAGVSVLRVHDVAATVQLVTLAAA